MPLSKCITGKTGYLVPDLGDQPFFITFFAAVVHKLVLHLLELFPGTKFSAHAPSQHIGLSKGKSGKIVSYFYYVFLVDHNAISLRHNI